MESDARGWIWLYCIFCAISITWSSRKYDVELEAQKLYKEDVRTVLHRFRRTTDYLKIVEASTKRFMVIYENLAMATLFHYSKKLEDKVKELMGYDRTTTLDDFVTDRTTPKYYRRSHVGMLRQNDNGQTENQNMIDLLDQYSKLTSKLTVAQKNEMKNLGFMYAGEVIHNIIKNLKEEGDETPDAESTRADFDISGNGKTTHVPVHAVRTGDARYATQEPVDNVLRGADGEVPPQGNEEAEGKEGNERNEGNEENEGIDRKEGTRVKEENEDFNFRSHNNNNNKNKTESVK